MTAFCHDHDIRLLIDAAHPFAEALHENLISLARQNHLPVIRYDRIYPPHTDDIIWCDDYQDAIFQLESQGIQRLLALTGVNTIAKLRGYWEQHECWFRILNRPQSLALAQDEHFPEDHLVYYERDDTAALILRILPDAILTKESGQSGGFTEKVEAARHHGLPVFVVKHPPYPPYSIPSSDTQVVCVNGPHGLRRAVEKWLPEFYPLHSGLTTGTCATAAAIAATTRLLRGEMPEEVPVVLHDGETINVGVTYGDGFAAVWKEGGDDPDVTDGLEVRASVAPLPVTHQPQVEILGGEGVGTFTLPGFDYPPGSHAINKVPRQMLTDNLSTFGVPLRVTISVPKGAETALRTFNPRLGIEGGISIIGVSGIVKPFSEEAFIDSIRKCMEVAKASGSPRVIINSGAKSERFVKAIYPSLPRQAFVEYGNYIGETLKIIARQSTIDVTLGVMLGKAVKLAAGHLDTHSRRATMDKTFVAQLLAESGITLDISSITLAKELWQLIPSPQLPVFAKTIIRHCQTHCAPLLPNARLTILLIDDDGNIYA